MDIKKCIIPAAGLGTRFLPFTKTIPKEMLPLLNKPAIQHVVEEGIHSDFENFVIVTGRGKNAIADHFDNSFELEAILRERNKIGLLKKIADITKNSSFSYIRQAEQLGLGHAVRLARHGIGKEHFGIILPDDIIISKIPAMEQIARIARQEKASVIAVQEVPMDCVSSYGVINIKKQITPSLFQVANMVEKPSRKEAPSNLAIIGRYILSYKIFQSLDEIWPYAVGELQLTDAISHMISNNEKVFAYKVQGSRYDIGTPIGWLKATISMSAQDPVLGAQIREYLKDLETIDSFIYNSTKNIEHSL